MSRWVLSQTFKDDINTDYGIYPESGEVVMEVIDKNTQYEQTTGATISNDGEVTKGRRISDYDNMYGKMEETNGRISYYEETYDNMYDKMG